jgi:hypothetical protein
MNALDKKRNRRVRGAELVVTGGALIISKFVLGWLAPVSLCVYGLYRWLFRKSYGEGIVLIASGVLLGILLKTILSGLLNLFLYGGIVVLAIGCLLMILPSKTED